MKTLSGKKVLLRTEGEADVTGRQRKDVSVAFSCFSIFDTTVDNHHGKQNDIIQPITFYSS